MAPIVLVHGNPETPSVWSLLTPHLPAGLDVRTPRLPGFGSSAPAGFGATQREYVDWLIGELESIGEPVHLVGHDWGGGLVIPVACERPDLLVSWASDVMGLFDPHYVWHDMAQVWQTPGAGDEAIAGMVAASVADRAAMYSSIGIPAAVAADWAAALDAEMGQCVLALYRSAAQPALADYSATHLAAAAARPGLVVIATDDPFTGGPAASERGAARCGASTHTLDGLGHWWMLDAPERGAAMLAAFWSSVEAG